MTDDPIPSENGDASSITERAANGEHAEELFPAGSLEGDAKTPQNIIRKGLPVKVTASIGKAEVPMPTGGLLDPDKAGRVLVSYAHAKNEDVREEEGGKTIGWKIRQHLRATYVEPANDEAALIRREFEALLALDAERAGGLLDELKALAAEALAAA